MNTRQIDERKWSLSFGRLPDGITVINYRFFHIRSSQLGVVNQIGYGCERYIYDLNMNGATRTVAEWGARIRFGTTMIVSLCTYVNTRFLLVQAGFAVVTRENCKRLRVKCQYDADDVHYSK